MNPARAQGQCRQGRWRCKLLTSPPCRLQALRFGTDCVVGSLHVCLWFPARLFQAELAPAVLERQAALKVWCINRFLFFSCRRAQHSPCQSFTAAGDKEPASPHSPASAPPDSPHWNDLCQASEGRERQGPLRTHRRETVSVVEIKYFLLRTKAKGPATGKAFETQPSRASSSACAPTGSTLGRVHQLNRVGWIEPKRNLVLPHECSSRRHSPLSQ